MVDIEPVNGPPLDVRGLCRHAKLVVAPLILRSGNARAVAAELCYRGGKLLGGAVTSNTIPPLGNLCMVGSRGPITPSRP